MRTYDRRKSKPPPKNRQQKKGCHSQVPPSPVINHETSQGWNADGFSYWERGRKTVSEVLRVCKGDDRPQEYPVIRPEETDRQTRNEKRHDDDVSHSRTPACKRPLATAGPRRSGMTQTE